MKGFFPYRFWCSNLVKIGSMLLEKLIDMFKFLHTTIHRCWMGTNNNRSSEWIMQLKILGLLSKYRSSYERRRCTTAVCPFMAAMLSAVWPVLYKFDGSSCSWKNHKTTTINYLQKNLLCRRSHFYYRIYFLNSNSEQIDISLTW